MYNIHIMSISIYPFCHLSMILEYAIFWPSPEHAVHDPQYSTSFLKSIPVSTLLASRLWENLWQNHWCTMIVTLVGLSIYWKNLGPEISSGLSFRHLPLCMENQKCCHCERKLDCKLPIRMEERNCSLRRFWEIVMHQMLLGIRWSCGISTLSVSESSELVEGMCV